MNSTELQDKICVVPAGAEVPFDMPGQLWVARVASAPFKIQFDDGNTVSGDAGFVYHKSAFRRFILKNQSATKKLVVHAFAGGAGIDFNTVRLPNTRVVCWDLEADFGGALANGDSISLPGFVLPDNPRLAVYQAHGIQAGAQRKYITVTLRPLLAGKIILLNEVTNKLLGLVAASGAGGGIPFETDEDLKLHNDTGGAIKSTVANPDIAIAETFYA